MAAMSSAVAFAVGEGFADRRELAVPDVHRVVLDPARAAGSAAETHAARSRPDVPLASKRIARELVVPWSSASTYRPTSGLLRLPPRPRVEPEIQSLRGVRGQVQAELTPTPQDVLGRQRPLFTLQISRSRARADAAALLHPVPPRTRPPRSHEKCACRRRANNVCAEAAATRGTSSPRISGTGRSSRR